MRQPGHYSCCTCRQHVVCLGVVALASTIRPCANVTATQSVTSARTCAPCGTLSPHGQSAKNVEVVDKSVMNGRWQGSELRDSYVPHTFFRHVLCMRHSAIMRRRSRWSLSAPFIVLVPVVPSVAIIRTPVVGGELHSARLWLGKNLNINISNSF